MDVETAEQEFANTAFEILDKNAIVKILERLNPVTVLSLCRTNIRFAEICQDQIVFRRLMKAHYPDFPLADDVKEQYMSIAGRRGTDYFVPILEKSESRGFPGVYAKEASVEPVQNAIEFTIYGTKIRKGEQIWLYCKVKNGKPSNKAIAFRTREDAIAATPIMSNRETAENYVKARLAEYRQAAGRVSRPGKSTSRNVGTNSEEFMRWLEDQDYPYPLTVEGVRKWIEEYGYIHRPCYVKSYVGVGRCSDFVIPVIIA